METPAAFISSSTSILHSFFFFSSSLFFIFFFLFPSPKLAAGLNFSVNRSNNFNKVTLSGDANWRWASGNAYFSILVTANVKLNGTKVGRATYADPLHLWDKKSGKIADFQTSFTFSINSENNSFHGDGLTFFLAPVNSTIPEGSGGGRLGLVSSSEINSDPNDEISWFVAVEFDTFTSEWETSLPIPHVGIDVNSVRPSDYIRWWNNVSMINPRWCQAWIAYDSNTMTLSVNFTGWYGEDSTAYDQTYGNLSYVVDLRKQLPEYVVVGFSASVGDLYENHEVRDWNFTSSDLLTIVDSPAPAPVDDSPAPPAVDIPAPNVYDDGGTRSKKKGGLVLGLSSGLGIPIALIIVVVVITCCYVNKKKKKNINTRKEEGPSPDDDKDEEADVFAEDAQMDVEFEKESGPKKFTYDELASSTNNFSEKQKLGEGGFGQVYLGFLKETESYVAVKRLSGRSQQGLKEYASEVKIISKLRHKNLVQFLGWCHRRGDLLLVYEYMSNKSLDYHLFKRDLIPLSWEVRYKVALGLASALLYLHEECEQCVLHRDIKSSNIMLDSTFNAKLGDFGLARSVDHEKGSHTTYIAGTPGYFAPESFTTVRATKESDVYSFGVVLLEIACGKKPIEVDQQTKLVEFVWNLYGVGNVLDAADPKLCGEFDEVEMETLLMVGLWCVHPDSNCRPKIMEAKHVLILEAPFLPNKIPRKMPKAEYYTRGSGRFVAGGASSSSSTVQTNTTSASSSLLSPH